MFEAAEVGRRVGKTEYKARETELRAALLSAQFALQRADIPVMLLFEGVDNSTKGEVVNLLNEWLDARGLVVNAHGPKSDEERERPRLWRYWRAMPKRGQIAVCVGFWYAGALTQLTFAETKAFRFDQQMRRVASQERMLALDGALILKFWLHLSKTEQHKRFRLLAKQPGARWILSDQDRKLRKRYEQLIEGAERMIRQTDLWLAPWVVVEAEDANFRNLTIGNTILAAMQRRLEGSVESVVNEIAPAELLQLPAGEEARRSILDNIDLSRRLDDEDYETRLARYQKKLSKLAWEAYRKKVSSVILFEGWDAAGKGSAIRRLLHAIDARISQVIQISAPTDEELAHHYLWRFWRHIPRAGHVTIYDRSWYGRVLVERVEGFAKESEWQRAYTEINDFEEQLAQHGIAVTKFWLHIDPEEQLRRFQARETILHKQHKITPDDYRNRNRWDDYELAVNEMVVRTSTGHSPWHLIAANDKKYARIQVIRQVCMSLEQALKRRPVV